MVYIISFILGVFSSIVAALLSSFVKDRYSSRFTFRRIFKVIMRLSQKIQADGYIPDYIVGIDRNGSIVASILSGYLGVHTIITAGTETIRRPGGARTVSLSPVYSPPEGALSGKRILIVGCFVDTGSALEIVYEYYASISNGPSEIKTASLFTTTAPRFKPNYFVYETGKNLKVSMNQIMRKMPWMTENWRYVLADER
jgi:hypoxanthine phosphoribosyltransferase